MSKNFLFLIIALLSTASCDTDPVDSEPEPQDYRDAFVGTYNGWRVSTMWTMNQPLQTTYDGPDSYVVEVVEDSFLSLNGSTPFRVGSDGQFSMHSGGSGFFSVRFVSPDSLLVTSQSGGLGGSSNSQFKGRK